MRKFYFLSCNSFNTIPLIGEIYRFIEKKFEIIVIQSSINGYDNIFDTSKRYKSVVSFNRYAEYNEQTYLNKLTKHIKFIFWFCQQVIVNRLTKEIVNLYSHELFPIALSLIFFRKNDKIIYHQFEVLPENLNIIDRLSLQIIELHSDKVDLMIFPEQNRAQLMINRVKYQGDYMIMPNSNSQQKKTVKPFSRQNKFVCTHIGSVGVEHNIENLLKAWKGLDQNCYQLIFVGRLSKNVSELISTYDYSNVEVIGQIPHSQLELYYQRTDLGLILYRDVGLNYRFCAPNKLYEYWSYGIPVMADQLEGLKSLFRFDFCGQLIDMSKPEKFLVGIEEISKVKREDLRDHFNENYNLKIFLEEFILKLD